MPVPQDPEEQKRELEGIHEQVYASFHLLTIKQSNQENVLKEAKEQVADAQAELKRTTDPELRKRLEQVTIPTLVKQVETASVKLSGISESLEDAQRAIKVIEMRLEQVKTELREKEERREEKRRRRKQRRK